MRAIALALGALLLGASSLSAQTAPIVIKARTVVHAQGPDSAKSAILAGCPAIEHGNRLSDEDITLMVQRGTYFDSNNHLMIHNYMENKAHFLGIGNYTESGFAYMERGLVSGNDAFKRALKAGVKIRVLKNEQR
jgi:imidazolonepropionase-like amidohydrolase